MHHPRNRNLYLVDEALGQLSSLLNKLSRCVSNSIPFFSSLFSSHKKKVIPALVFPVSYSLNALPFRLYLLRKAYKRSPTH